MNTGFSRYCALVLSESLRASGKEGWVRRVLHFHPTAKEVQKPAENGSLMMRAKGKIVSFYNPKDGKYTIKNENGMIVE